MADSNTVSSELTGAEPHDLLHLIDEAGVIDTLFCAMTLMAEGLSVSEESNAVHRVVLIAQERFRLLLGALERMHESEGTAGGGNG